MNDNKSLELSLNLGTPELNSTYSDDQNDGGSTAIIIESSDDSDTDDGRPALPGNPVIYFRRNTVSTSK